MILKCNDCPCCMQEYKELCLCCYTNKWMTNDRAKYCDYAIEQNILSEVNTNV